MKTAAGIVAVFFLSIINVYVAIPMGSEFNLPLWTTALVALIGSVGGTMAMVFAGDKFWPVVRRRINKIRGRKEEDPEADAKPDKEGKAAKIANKWGARGLGLIAPFTIGGFAGAIAGVALELPRGKLALWLGLSQGIFVVLYTLLLDVTVGK